MEWHFFSHWHFPEQCAKMCSWMNIHRPPFLTELFYPFHRGHSLSFPWDSHTPLKPFQFNQNQELSFGKAARMSYRGIWGPHAQREGLQETGESKGREISRFSKTRFRISKVLIWLSMSLGWRTVNFVLSLPEKILVFCQEPSDHQKICRCVAEQ